MLFPVSVSSEVMVADVLPGIKTKISHKGTGLEGKIYAFARMYIHEGSLRVTTYAFEREPSVQSRIGFSLFQKDSDIVFAEISRDGGSLYSLPHPQHNFPVFPGELPGKAKKSPLDNITFFSGNDEQGWYWSASFELSHVLLTKAGCSLSAGEEFWVALYKYEESLPCYSSSFNNGFPSPYPPEYIHCNAVLY